MPKRKLGMPSCRVLLLLLAGAAAIQVMGQAASLPRNDPPSFFVPQADVTSHYRIDARLDLKGSLLKGTEVISFKNPSPRVLKVIALAWNLDTTRTLEVRVHGKSLACRSKGEKGTLYFDLPSPIPPGGILNLAARFSRQLDPSAASEGFSETVWYPRLQWDGRQGHDDYSVKLEIPPNLGLAVSGRKDVRTGRYLASGIRAFGLYVDPGVTTQTREVDGVLVSVLSTPKGRKAAEACLETAVDAIRFYKRWLGFYPYPFLTIVPGGSGRWGGFPFAPGIVAIHGLETYHEGESPRWWQHITSHEIGHQYWSEWVLDGDRPGWLWIALGIYLDTEFMINRNHDPDQRVAWMENYLDATRSFHDTTLDVTPGQEARFNYDRNNLAVHSKGPACINALEVVLGREAFEGILRKALHAYGGRRLDWREFQRFCEREMGQDLGWFFEAWVRDSSYLCYEIKGKDCRQVNHEFRTEIQVAREGTMAMPVPVRVIFEDGTEQTRLTDRTQSLDTVVFTSKARMKEVVLDPERRLAMLSKPLPALPDNLAARLGPGWDTYDSPEIFKNLKDLDLEAPDLWLELGTRLFDLDHFDEAAVCFLKLLSLPGTVGAEYQFPSQVWLGVIEDMRSNRDNAVAHYRAALTVFKGKSWSFGQLSSQLDRAWVEECIRKPFTRASELSLPDHPTATQLEECLNLLNWTHEGKNPKTIYDLAISAEIPKSGFWFKLGMLLFDSGEQEASLAAFAKAATAADASRTGTFGAWVWQGHLNDLLERRDAALADYRKALELDSGDSIRHDQYNMSIGRSWVEQRLKSPFRWK